MNTITVDDLIVSDLESNVLPSRDAAGKRIFSNGESSLLRQRQNDVNNTKIEVSDAQTLRIALEAKVPIAQKTLSERMTTYDANKAALLADMDKVDGELSEKESKLSALDAQSDKGSFKAKRRLICLKDIGMALGEEVILLTATFSLMSYAFSTSTILLRSVMVVFLGIFSMLQHILYEKHKLKSILVMYSISMLLGFFALISAVLSCYVIQSESPVVSSYSLNLTAATEQINSNNAASGTVLSFLKNMWLTTPGIFALIIGFLLLVLSCIIGAIHKEKSAAPSASDRLINSLKRECMILSQKKDRCVAAMKDLELTYKADCRYLNGELERLKDDILMASKRESDAETKLSEVFETLLNQLVDYDKELKSIYELYHNKDIEVVSTNIQDIECYYSNPSINY